MNQEYHDINYKPPGNQYDDLTNTSTIFEEAPPSIERGSSSSLCDEVVATDHPINIAIPTINHDLAYPDFITRDQQNHVPHDLLQNDKAVAEIVSLQDDISPGERNNDFEVVLDTSSYLKKKIELLNPDQSKGQKSQSLSENLFEAQSDQKNRYRHPSSVPAQLEDQHQNLEKKFNLLLTSAQVEDNSSLCVKATIFTPEEQEICVTRPKSASSIKISTHEVLETVDPNPPWHHDIFIHHHNHTITPQPSCNQQQSFIQHALHFTLGNTLYRTDYERTLLTCSEDANLIIK